MDWGALATGALGGIVGVVAGIAQLIAAHAAGDVAAIAAAEENLAARRGELNTTLADLPGVLNAARAAALAALDARFPVK